MQEVVLSSSVGNGAYMGVSSSTLNKLVNAEFHRLAKGRAYITLDEVLEFRLQSGGWDISTDCIGVLFSIDWYAFPRINAMQCLRD